MVDRWLLFGRYLVLKVVKSSKRTLYRPLGASANSPLIRTKVSRLFLVLQYKGAIFSIISHGRRSLTLLMSGLRTNFETTSKCELI